MVSTHLKNISPNGDLPQIGMNVQKYLKPPPSYCLTTSLPPESEKHQAVKLRKLKKSLASPCGSRADQCNKHKQTPATDTLPITNSKSPVKMGNIFASSKRQFSGVNALLLSGRKDASRVGKTCLFGNMTEISMVRPGPRKIGVLVGRLVFFNATMRYQKNEDFRYVCLILCRNT